MGLDEQLMVERGTGQGTGQGTGPIRTLVEIAAIGAVLGVAGGLVIFSIPEFSQYFSNTGLQEKLLLFGLSALEGALALPAIAYGGYGLLRSVAYFAGHHI